MKMGKREIFTDLLARSRTSNKIAPHADIPPLTIGTPRNQPRIVTTNSRMPARDASESESG